MISVGHSELARDVSGLKRRAGSLPAALWATSVAVAGLCAGRPVDAQSAPSADQGTSATPRLETIVVTANKRTQSTLDVADSVTAIGSPQLDQLGAQTISDYVDFVPGLQITPGANNGQQTVIIRGIAPQLSSPTTATYIDDIPVGAVSGQGAGAYFAVDVDPSELQRVEVLNGPQGTIYGSSSLGGVVKYVTKQPDLKEMTGQASVDGFDVDHGEAGVETRAALSAPLITDKLGLSISGHFRHDPGYLDNLASDTSNANSGTDEGGRLALYLVPSSGWKVKLGILYDRTTQNSDNAIPINELTRAPTYGRYIQFHPDHTNAGTYQQLSLYSATISRSFENGATLTSATGYSNLSTHLMADESTTFVQHELAGLGLIAPDDGIQADVPYTTGHLTEELRLTSPDTKPIQWMAGFFYQHETDTPEASYFAVNPDGSVYTPPPPFSVLLSEHGRDTLRELAGFGNATYYFERNLWLTLGYRYSSISQSDSQTNQGLFLNPTNPVALVPSSSSATNSSSTYLATLSWKPTDNTELYARAASGYRPGGNQNTPPGAPANFKTTYDSDGIWNYEVGLKGDWLDSRLHGTLAAYWIDWRNIQEQLVVSSFFVTGNGGQARSRGFEGSLAAIPFQGMTVTASLSYTDATFLQSNAANGIVAGEAIPQVSKLTGGLAAEYARPITSSWSAVFGADVQFRTANETVDHFTQDGYDTIGLHAGMSDDNWRVMAYAKNLMDQYRYITAESAVGSVPFYTTILQPRTVGVSIARKF